MKRDSVTFATEVREIRHFHGFCGSGAGAKGFNMGHARVGGMVSKSRCIGGFDVNPASVRNFKRMTGVAATVMDAFSRDQYTAYNGKEPPPGWREATADDVRRAAGGERPHLVFLSSPCMGFSGLLSESKSKTDKYTALNELSLRGLWLMLEAWGDDPPEMFVMENVPRLLTRGRHLVDQIVALFRAYGYAVSESVHDCGELGGLGETRKRCLIVARHLDKVPSFLYEPPRRRLRPVGDVLRHLPVPGLMDEFNPMHRVPSLAWKTWVRLAFVEAGSDWRSLNRLNVQDGMLRDYLIVPTMFRGGLGVHRWEDTTGTIAGESWPLNGAFSVADVRAGEAVNQRYQQYGVRRWDEPSGTITGQSLPGGGTFSVSDPRCETVRHNHVYRVVRYDEAARAVTSAGGCVADPRPTGPIFGKYAVTEWDKSTGTVISGSTTGQGAFAVADVRSGMAADRAAYKTGGHYGVLRWTDTSGTVSASACHDNGPWSIADHRMPESNESLAATIIAEDGTWHRPFTTLELAAIQSFFDPEDPVEAAAFALDGKSDSAHRKEIGNAVPPASAAAIASEMFRTLLLSWAGESIFLHDTPVWVRPLVTGISLPQVV